MKIKRRRKKGVGERKKEREEERKTKEEGGRKWMKVGRSEYRERSEPPSPSRELLLAATWKGLVGSSDLTARNLLSDTINIGPRELSQLRISVANESAAAIQERYPLCGFRIIFFLILPFCCPPPVFFFPPHREPRRLQPPFY